LNKALQLPRRPYSRFVVFLSDVLYCVQTAFISRAGNRALVFGDQRYSGYNADMTAETFDRTLRAFQRRTPFQPFTVELVSGYRFQIDHPEAMVYRSGTGIYVASDGTPTLFDHEGVSRLVGESLQKSAS